MVATRFSYAGILQGGKGDRSIVPSVKELDQAMGAKMWLEVCRRRLPIQDSTIYFCCCRVWRLKRGLRRWRGLDAQGGDSSAEMVNGFRIEPDMRLVAVAGLFKRG